MAVLNAICHKAPKSACDINSNVPKPLDAIIERLMKKSPDDRFGTAAEVRKLLAEYLAYLQNPSQNSLPVELSPVRRIKPGWVAGVATVICSLLLVVVFAAWPQSGNTTDEELPDTTSSQFAGPPSQPTIPDFNRAVQNLQTRIAETEEEWRIEATPQVVLDDWVQSVELLNEQFRKLEQEWSGSLTD